MHLNRSTHFASAADVNTVIVNGRMLLDDRKPLLVSPEDVLAEAEAEANCDLAVSGRRPTTRACANLGQLPKADHGLCAVGFQKISTSLAFKADKRSKRKIIPAPLAFCLLRSHAIVIGWVDRHAGVSNIRYENLAKLHKITRSEHEHSPHTVPRKKLILFTNRCYPSREKFTSRFERQLCSASQP